jgi:hypothetical protein
MKHGEFRLSRAKWFLGYDQLAHANMARQQILCQICDVPKAITQQRQAPNIPSQDIAPELQIRMGS